MAIQLNEYVRKPFVVQAVQVTADNMNEVARWCSGKVKQSYTEKPGGMEGEVYYIKVEVKRPLDDRQTQAFIGDFVLAAGQSFKVYTEFAFNKSFVPHIPEPAPAPKPKPGPTGRRRPKPGPGPDLSPIGGTTPAIAATPIHKDQLTVAIFKDVGFPEEPAEMREEHLRIANTVVRESPIYPLD